MKRFFALERVGMDLALATRMSYRADFFISIAVMFLFDVIQPVFILLLYGISAGFPGWTLAEMILLTGFVLTGASLAGMFISGILWNTIRLVRQGRLDNILILPGNPLVNLLTRSFDVEDVGKVVAGTATLIIGAVMTGLTIGEFMVLVLLLPVPVLLFGSVGIIGSALAIKYINTFRLYEFLSMIQDFSKYPATIYPRALQTIFYTVLPVAAVGFVPSGLVLGKLAPFAFASIASVIIFFTAAILYWHWVLAEYASAGG